MDQNWKEVCCISDKWQDVCKKLTYSDVQFKKIRKKKYNPKQHCSAANAASKAIIEMNYIDIVAFTSLDWCTVLLDFSSTNSTTVATSHQKYALLAAATKSGKVTFWKVAVPLSSGVADVELTEGDLQSSVTLPCSIAWYSRDGFKGDYHFVHAVQTYRLC
jgi:hypothetical protein